MRVALGVLALALAGCITHLPPPPNHPQMRIEWAPDFEHARARAQQEDKPIYAVLAAGELDGLC
jgi:hypothetical protein